MAIPFLNCEVHSTVVRLSASGSLNEAALDARELLMYFTQEL